jgi:uncharacterized protein YjbI with pentapeptide repeats
MKSPAMDRIWRALTGPKVMAGVSSVAACAFFLMSHVSGYNEEDLQRLKTTRNCRKCDLSHARLSSLDLSYADLSAANLMQADLSKSKLYRAFFSRAYLSGASLSEADLTEATLDEANLSGANLFKANLTATILSRTVWTDGKKCKPGSIGRCKK